MMIHTEVEGDSNETKSMTRNEVDKKLNKTKAKEKKKNLRPATKPIRRGPQKLVRLAQKT